MIEPPQGWAPDALLHMAKDLRDGDTVELPSFVTTTQLINLLAWSPGGADEERRDRARTFIHDLISSGRFIAVPSGRHESHAVATLAAPINVGGRGINALQQRSKAPPRVTTIETKLLSLVEVGKRRQSIKDESLWSVLCEAVFEPNSTDSKANAVDAANTRVPLQVFIRRCGPYFDKGKAKSGEARIESLHKNRGAPDRKPSPYDEAFNDDGTVNELRFIEIAKAKGEWKETEIRLPTWFGRNTVNQ